jgi:integrase
MVINTLREWRAACPPGPLGLVFPNGSGNVESHTNITHRFWEPLQLANEIAQDTGRKDAEGRPILEPKYGLHALRHAAASLLSPIWDGRLSGCKRSWGTRPSA